MQNGLSKEDLNLLIGEMAKRHNLLLRPDDPILTAVALNDIMLQKALAQLNGALEEQQTLIAATSAHQIEAAKEAASELITAAAGYAHREIHTAADRAAEHIITTLKEIAAPSLRAIETAEKTRSIAIWAAALACFAAFVTGMIAVLFPLALN